MHFEFVIAVWGDWHINAMGRAMLPTLLSDGNLPRVLAEHSGRMRILTRRADEATIARLPSFRSLAQILPTEIMVVTEGTPTSASDHLKWWHEVGQVSRPQTFVVNLPPDVVWADGAIFRICQAMAGGYKAALAPPHIRVVSETCIGELETRARTPVTSGITMSPQETVALGMKHLHPLSALAIAGKNRHGRPGIEHLWAVPGEGLLLCQTTREVIAYDPAKCGFTAQFLLNELTSLDDVYYSASSEENFMLSLAPLAKDLGLLLQGLPITAQSLARWATHPHNDTPISQILPRTLVSLNSAPMSPKKWRAVETEARRWVQQFECWRSIFRLWRDIVPIGCETAGRIIGLAAHAMDLPSALPAVADATIFVPTDQAVAEFPLDWRERFLGVGRERELADFLCAHVVSGRHYPPNKDDTRRVKLRSLAGKALHMSAEPDGRPLVNDAIRILKTIELAEHVVHIVDGSPAFVQKRSWWSRGNPEART